MAAKSFLNRPLAGLAVILLFAVSAMSRADDVSRQFPVEGFTRIELKGDSRLEVVQGEVFEVIASGPKEIVDLAVAEVRGDTLELSVRDKHRRFFGVVTVSDSEGVDYRVVLPRLESLEVTGSGDARAELLESESLDLEVTGSGSLAVDKVAAESLQAAVTGSGDLSLGTVLAVEGRASIKGSGDIRLDSVIGDSFGAEIKGSGDMVVGGKVASLSISIMGSGDFLGRNLQSDDAEGTVMGSGDIVLRRPARESFSVMGSGDIALVE
ncbi:GIN domain-containing protein [Microbulbifer sediminum]|uniref:GIN domain-containing protein n=1 Tax=Microbulbifer sediminum TaxID=2904250 RepID=UPI001F284E12|nr:DUF2807 domain-containing protein [Microbulbifer sediminum]